jgi:hypothetical protein
MLATCSPPSASVTALWPLRQDHTKLGVVSVLVDVVNADVSLQIVRSRVAMLLVRAERAEQYRLGRGGLRRDERSNLPDVSWTLVNEAVPDHLVLSLKPLSCLASGTVGHGTIVGSNR